MKGNSGPAATSSPAWANASGRLTPALWQRTPKPPTATCHRSGARGQVRTPRRTGSQDRSHTWPFIIQPWARKEKLESVCFLIPERTGIPTFAFILFFSLRYVTLLTLVSKTDQVFRLRAEPAAVAELLLNPFSDTGTDDSRFGRAPSSHRTRSSGSGSALGALCLWRYDHELLRKGRLFRTEMLICALTRRSMETVELTSHLTPGRLHLLDFPARLCPGHPPTHPPTPRTPRALPLERLP